MANKKNIECPKIVYLEAVLMANDEVIHFGKSLGFINDRQKDLIESEATKLTRGGEVVIALKDNVA